jgi:hypothetical protein
MTHQVALTMRATVQPERLASLQTLLTEMDSDRVHNPFTNIPGTHFARILVFGGEMSTLVLMLDVDAPARTRLRDIVAFAGVELDDLFDHCTDYPQSVKRTVGTRLRYVRRHLVGSNVFYVHAVGRTVPQIRQEARLRKEIEEFLDRGACSWQGCSTAAIWGAIQAFVRSQPSLSWALTPPAPPGLAFRLRESVHKVAIPLVLLLALPLLIPSLLLWVVALRVHELVDPAPRVNLDPDRLRALGDAEDFGVQNAFTSLAPIKPGRFWQLTSAMTVGFANYSARHVFTKGSLSGLTTVHFARFMRVGPGSQMLFTSYYDGSLESYNNDFIDQVAWVLNTVFGQEQGYPRTRWMVLDGARDEAGFKAFIRGHQIATPVWYSAYPELSAVTIDQNARIRRGLSGEITGTEVDELVRLL